MAADSLAGMIDTAAGTDLVDRVDTAAESAVGTTDFVDLNLLISRRIWRDQSSQT